MYTNDDLFEGVGVCSKVDHVAIQTEYGMTIPAKEIFRKLGFKINLTRKAEGSWGKAIFMDKLGSISIQITDSTDPMKIVAGENHIAIMVDDPHDVALAMFTWLLRGGINALPPKEVPGGKWFVDATGILTMPIELVPGPRLLCPECDGTGEIIKGSEGRGLHYICEKCKGKKSIPLVLPNRFFD